MAACPERQRSHHVFAQTHTRVLKRELSQSVNEKALTAGLLFPNFH